jgi:ferric-dicitrate binding protein FerR (iron transport regulator)
MEKDYILHKYLNKEATTQEIELLKNDAEYKRYLEIADVTTTFEVPAFNKKGNLEAISDKINTTKKVRKLNPMMTVLKIAAVVAVLFAGYIFVSNLDTNISTTIAETKTVVLPDNSQVTLNANSTISFQKNQWEDTRTVHLKGEAYFKVAKGKQFDVNTTLGKISVLGTQFNVFARGKKLSVFCYEGLVEVSFNNQKIQVPADHSLKWNNGVLTTSINTSLKEPSWIHSESSFENDKLSFVLNELERQYEITVIAENIDTSIQFTGSFTHTNLTIALQSICEPLQLQYIINENNIIINEKEAQ